MRWRRAIVLLLGCLLFVVCGTVVAKADADYEGSAAGFVEAFGLGEYEAAYEMFNETAQQAITLEQLEQAGGQLIAQFGDFVAVGEVALDETPVAEAGVNYRIAFVYAEYETTIAQMRMVVQEETGEVAGFQLAGVEAKTVAAPPDGVIEEEVIIGEDTEFPINAVLSYPAEMDGPLPAVVLVHGSGPNDRDETIGPNKPFRDIAWGLAERGIAVLRYDKRTFAYGAEMQASEEPITVRTETIEDAELAVDYLRNHLRIDSDRVAVLGHSLGGILAPVIAEETNAWKLVIMAGTLRPLWAVLEGQLQRQPEAMEAYAEMNTVDIEKLHEVGDFSFISDEDAKDEMFYIISVDYLKDLGNYDMEQIILGLTAPMLILQGGEDYQILSDADFTLYQETLAEKTDVIMKEYPLLNHLFQTRNIENEDVFQEYTEDHPVEEEVIEDIAAFLLQE